MGIDLDKIVEYFPPDATKTSTVIFMHDMLCTKEIWGDMPRRVSAHSWRPVYTYDARSHGANRLLGRFNFPTLLDDILTIINEKDMPNVILVGHGMGGKIAIRAALAIPEKVVKVIIVDAHVDKIPDHLIDRSQKFLKSWRRAVQALPATINPSDVTRLSIENLYATMTPAEQIDPERQSYLKSNFEYIRSQNNKYDVTYNAEELDFFHERYKRNGEPELSGQYNNPAYFLYGTVSPYRVWEKESEIRKYFPNAQFVPFVGAPHLVFAKDPEEFLRKLCSYIN